MMGTNAYFACETHRSGVIDPFVLVVLVWQDRLNAEFVTHTCCGTI